MRITGSVLPILPACQYWARPEVDAPPMPANESMQLGTEVHAAIDAWLLGDAPQPSELSEDAAPLFAAWLDWWQGCDLAKIGKWKSEQGYKYNPKTFTAVPLGRIVGREYGAVDADEIAGSIDALCVVGKEAHIIDWKTGMNLSGMTEDAKDNKQLRGYALSVAHAHGLETVHVYVARISEDGVKLSQHTLDTFDIADAAETLRSLVNAIPSSKPSPGMHCRRCRAVAVCPSTIKAAEEIAPMETAIDAPAHVPLTITQDNAAPLYARLLAVRAACDAVESALKMYVDANGGISLDNGKVYKKTETNRSSIKLDGPEGAVAVETLREHGVGGAVEVVPRTSQAAIKRLIQAAGLKGKEANAKLDQIMADLNRDGAIRSTTVTSYRES